MIDMTKHRGPVRVAVYAGSFDPPTNGHLYVLSEATFMFDWVVVAIGTNTTKQPMFSLEERLEMLEKITEGMEGIVVSSFPNTFLVKYAKEIGANILFRGLRGTKDTDDEKVLFNFNHNKDPEIHTALTFAPIELCDLSSSHVKSLLPIPGWEEDVAQMVPPFVLAKIKGKVAK